MKKLIERKTLGIGNEANNVEISLTEVDNVYILDIALSLSYSPIESFLVSKVVESLLTLWGEIRAREQVDEAQNVYIWHCPFDSECCIKKLDDILRLIYQRY